MALPTLPTAILAGALSLCLSSCAPFDATSAVRTQFVGEATCPSDRVTVTHASPTPPPDVAADPGRLAVWSAQVEKSLDYVARGCGQERRYSCIVPNGSTVPYDYQCTSPSR